MGSSHPLGNRQVVLFDGICNLCNASVRWIIANDSKGKFQFAPLQSAVAKTLLASSPAPPESLKSVVLVRNGEVLIKSDAVFEIVRQLDGGWPLLSIFRVVPRGIRDGVYNWISKNRYSWFGHRDKCMTPSPALKSRFLE